MKEQLAIDVREFIQEYFDAWQEGVTEKILSYYSDDVVINLLGGPALLEGRSPSLGDGTLLAAVRNFEVSKVRVVRDDEDTAENRTHTQYGKVTARNQLSRELRPRLIVCRQVQQETTRGKHAREHLVMIAERAVQRGGKRLFYLLPVSDFQQHELLRIPDRQHLHQHCVYQAKNGRIRSDAECQSQHCYCGKAGTLEQHSKGVAKIIKHRG